MKQMRTMCRKWTVFLLIFVLLGCGRKQSGKEQPKAADADDRLRIVTTIFPYYDFVRQIAGDQVELTLIVPAGMDSHSFDPECRRADLQWRSHGTLAGTGIGCG